MIRRHFIGGIVLFLIGVYFLIGGLSWLPENSQAMVWPFALIIAGILFFFKPGRDKKAKWARRHAMEHRQKWMEMHQGRPGMNFGNEQQQQSDSVDGFLHSENVWGLHATSSLTNYLKEPKSVLHLAGQLLICAIPILRREKPISTWIVTGAELRYMPLPIGKSYLNVTPSLAGVMTSVGRTGMLIRTVY